MGVGEEALMHWYFSSPFGWPDPGPCPVDDAPHTTCTSADYAPLVILQLPARDALSAAPTVRPPHRPLGPTEFTTATYRRSRDGMSRKAAK
jgi:hypothetical protein